MNNDSPAVVAATEHGLQFEIVSIGRVDSAEEAAAARGIALRQLIKTIVIRRGPAEYLFVLVPGDRAIDWNKLRAELGVSRLSLPDAAEALEVTGYERGAITPFGSTNSWPVYADERLLSEPVVSIGGGRHGLAIHCAPEALFDALDADVRDLTKAQH